jgi:hypothetical protein
VKIRFSQVQSGQNQGTDLLESMKAYWQNGWLVALNWPSNKRLFGWKMTVIIVAGQKGQMSAQIEK